MNQDAFLNKYEILKDDISENKKDYIGKEFSNLKILDLLYVSYKGNDYRKYLYAKCLCIACNNICYEPLYAITSNAINSCGCLKSFKAIKLSTVKLELSKEKYIGKIYNTNEGYKIKIIDLKSTHDVLIEFINVDEPYQVYTTMQNIKNGQIKYPFRKNKFGGYYGVGPYKAFSDGNKTKEYRIWMGILFRCGRPNNPAYKNISVCNEWLNFQNFAKWFNNNYYESPIPLEIDKDILSYYEKKKEYSPNNCIFIPNILNIKLAYIKDKQPQEIISIIKIFKNCIPKNVFNRIEEYYKSNSCSKTY